jgi:GNAT superfamily N-acetyltransferase
LFKSHIDCQPRLFLEYAQSLGFSLCFQGFDKELADLPGDYSSPDGRLLLAHYDAQRAACAALHKLDPGICEMKRLYLRPQFRGKGLGRVLAERIIAEARQIGYQCMRFDTVEPVMKAALAMSANSASAKLPCRVNPCGYLHGTAV